MKNFVFGLLFYHFFSHSTIVQTTLKKVAEDIDKYLQVQKVESAETHRE